MHSAIDAAGELIGIEVHGTVSVANMMQSVATPLLHDLNIILLIAQQLHVQFQLRVDVLILAEETTFENAHFVYLYSFVLSNRWLTMFLTMNLRVRKVLLPWSISAVLVMS